MKDIVVIALLLTAIGLTACSKDEPEENNNPQEQTVPAGIEDTHDVPTDRPAL